MAGGEQHERCQDGESGGLGDGDDDQDRGPFRGHPTPEVRDPVDQRTNQSDRDRDHEPPPDRQGTRRPVTLSSTQAATTDAGRSRTAAPLPTVSEVPDLRARVNGADRRQASILPTGGGAACGRGGVVAVGTPLDRWSGFEPARQCLDARLVRVGLMPDVWQASDH